MAKTPKPTSGKAWRKAREEGFVITLPSGNVARLRPVALDVLIASGNLPNLLTPIAAKSLWVEEEVENIGNEAELAKGFAELVNAVVPAAFLEPQVVDDPQEDGEISLEDIDFNDKVTVFQLVTQPVEVLRRFRDRQSADVEPVPDGEDDEQPPEQPDSD